MTHFQEDRVNEVSSVPNPGEPFVAGTASRQIVRAGLHVPPPATQGPAA